MGGSSSSRSDSASNIEDKRLAVSSGVGITGDGNSVTYSNVDGGAIKMAGDVAMTSLYVTDNSVQSAISGMVKTTENSLFASNLATQSAIESANRSLSQSLSANTSVTRDAMSIADRSQILVANSAADSLGMVSHLADLAMKSSNEASNTVGQAVNQVARAYDTATNYQAEKATTDSRYLVIAGLVVVGLAAVKGFK